MKLDFDDLLIKPVIITDIKSRTEINPFDQNGMLPLITAPMDTVVDESNADLFYDNKINICLPRGEKRTKHHMFQSYSLSQFKSEFCESSKVLSDIETPIYVLIDTANGHIQELVDVVEYSKKFYGDKMVLMVGNIANPETYRNLSEAGADYIRVGIGNGCFVDGVKVTTDKGYKNIEDINVGEKVLTHKGEFKTVLNTKNIEYEGEVIKINENITCTLDHKFYVLNKKNIDIVNDENIHIFCEWVSAEEIFKNPVYLLIEHKSSNFKYTEDENKF